MTTPQNLPRTEEIAREAYRNVQLVATGMYPENVDTNKLNHDAAINIIKVALDTERNRAEKSCSIVRPTDGLEVSHAAYIDDLTAALQAATTRAEEAEKENKRWGDTCAKALNERDALQAKADELERQLEMLGSTNAIRNAHIDELEKEVATFRAWCLHAFGLSHPEMFADNSPSYSELTVKNAHLQSKVEAYEGELTKFFSVDREQTCIGYLGKNPNYYKVSVDAYDALEKVFAKYKQGVDGPSA